MYLSEFWSKFGLDIVISSIFILASIFLLVTLIVNLGRNNTSKKLFFISGIVLGLVLLALNFTMIKDYNSKKLANPDFIFPIAKILIFNAFVIVVFVVINYLFNNSKEKVREKISVSTLSILALLVALASVLMLFGIPIFPAFDYLKVEVSALIYFMIFLWFGIKPTIIVILITNVIHIFIPLTPPLIFGLDESANVVACLVFLTPSFIAFRKLPKNEAPNFSKVIMTSIIGVVLTTVFMVLYNYFLFIPMYEKILEFSMGFDFLKTLTVFGPFNLIKWSAVSLVVIFLHQKLNNIKHQIERI